MVCGAAGRNQVRKEGILNGMPTPVSLSSPQRASPKGLTGAPGNMRWPLPLDKSPSPNCSTV